MDLVATMRVLVTGATGFIGRRLVREFRSPVILSRNPERARRLLGADGAIHRWEPEAGPPPAAAFEGVGYVFHLAGDPIASGRWSPAKKTRMHASRVAGTRNLVAGLAGLQERPKVLVAASAVGYYGDRGDEILDESAAPGDDFLARLCVDWEAESKRAADLGMRVVVARNGIVLGGGGGSLARMLPPFRLGLGGPIASGRQWMPWIADQDLVGLYIHAALHEALSGPMNAVAPRPVTNREFTRTLASLLERPAVFPLPEFALRVMFGEVAEVLVASQRVVPNAAEKSNYQFVLPTLTRALRSALGKRPSNVETA